MRAAKLFLKFLRLCKFENCNVTVKKRREKEGKKKDIENASSREYNGTIL